MRGLQSVHQSRLPRLDDETVGVSLSSSPLVATSAPSSSSSLPAASSLPALDRKVMSSAPKLSRKDVHRLVQEAMAIGAQPHNPVQFPTYKVGHEVDKGSFTSTQDATSLATKCRLMEKSLDLHMEECSNPLEAPRNNDNQAICMEVADHGAQWSYSLRTRPGKEGESMFSVMDTKYDKNPFNDLMVFVRSWLVPEGYPESVSPSYTPYMRWRAMKYLFGGAMNVFTTRSLLHAVGVSRHGSATTAMAVNWVIKDGAGRVGKLLFARQGKKFDYDMKQLRFTGDLLMELGAAVELATVAAPHLFLPLACAANVAKNVAAVASTSTRAPIYKSFARGENIGDVTARGECISNIADLVGTGLGIFLSKKNPSLMVTFAVLSCGYLCCSYNEVKSVCLATLNRARFKVAVQSFLETGRVPSVSKGNREESIFRCPWVTAAKPFALGARINEAFQNPHTFLKLLPLFQKENYLVTYNPSKRRAFAILKKEARSDDVLKASFHAQVLEDLLRRPLSARHGMRSVGMGSSVVPNSSEISIEAAIRESCKLVPRLFESFKKQALSEGWVMGESLLNPGAARLCI